jgi:hypothetical protein
LDAVNKLRQSSVSVMRAGVKTVRFTGINSIIWMCGL